MEGAPHFHIQQEAEIFIEHKTKKGIVGNIYKGVVTKVLPGMQVAFVDIGLERAGFLYVGDIDVIDLLEFEGEEENHDVELMGEKVPSAPVPSQREQGRGVPIQSILKEGQEIMVQVAKNPMGTKGARITSFITLAGRHVVYMPTVNQISASRRIENEDEKERLKKLVITGLPLPLLSYGGSSLITHFFALGLLLSMDMRRTLHP